MAKAVATCTCKKCGKHFEKSAIKCNRREADAWAAWAEENFDLCSECYKAEAAEAAAEKVAKYALPEITGVSEKQIAYALSLRTRHMATVSAADVDFAKNLIAEIEESAAEYVKDHTCTAAELVALKVEGYEYYGATKTVMCLLTADAHTLIDALLGKPITTIPAIPAEATAPEATTAEATAEATPAEATKKMAKTYYSVVYSSWGCDAPQTAWFDDLDVAKAFAAGDYRDGVVRHRCTNSDTIDKYNDFVAMTHDAMGSIASDAPEDAVNNKEDHKMMTYADAYQRYCGYAYPPKQLYQLMDSGMDFDSADAESNKQMQAARELSSLLVAHRDSLRKPHALPPYLKPRRIDPNPQPKPVLPAMPAWIAAMRAEEANRILYTQDFGYGYDD